MPSLLDPLPDDGQALVRTVATGFAEARGRWPIWQYVLHRMDVNGHDAEVALRGLPTWGHRYRPVVVTSGVDMPALGDPVGLTVHGIFHAASAATDPLMSAFIGSLVIAEEAQSEVTPNPTDVVSVVLDGDDLTVRVNKRAGSAVSGSQLQDLLGREPSTWSGVLPTTTGWQWDLSRARVRPYRGIRNGSDYLVALEALVGADYAPPAVHLPPLALPEAFDHLDLAWRLLTKKRLVRVPRASVAAKLTQQVNSADEFESRCSALSDLLGNLAVPQGDLPNESKPLQRLDQELTRLLGPEDRALEAVTTLRRIAGIRNAQQHSGSSARYDADRAKLGLPRFGSDWSGAWEHIRFTTVVALTTIRESVEGIIDRAEDPTPG